MGTRGRTPRHAVRPSGQHFLRSAAIAAELVEHADIREDDLVLEIGAGTGSLTRALGSRAGRVLAVELDPDLAARLRRTFSAKPRVTVVEADALAVRLPSRPFRAFGNLPFDGTTRLLRRLLDEPESPLLRADLIVQYEVARKHAAPWPSSLRSLSWAPWWEFVISRRLPSACFDPRPSVDAAMLSVTRRAVPLLEPGRRRQFDALVVGAFGRSPAPVRRSVPVSPSSWKRFARDRGLRRDAAARELSIFDWVALYEVVSQQKSQGAAIPGRANPGS